MQENKSQNAIKILDRIKEARNIGTDTELANFLDVKQNTISTWRKRNSVDYETIITKCDNLNLDWLLTGRGKVLSYINLETCKEHDIDEKEQAEKAEYKEQADVLSQATEPEISIYKLKTDYYGVDKQLIPLYEIEASAGLNMLFTNQSTQIPLDYISVPNAPKCDGALYIRGDSMYPVLKAGDIVCFKIIKEFQDVRPGEMYVLDIEDNSDRYLTVKYIQRSDISDEYFKLVSQNTNHQSKEEHKSHIKALAIVKLSIRYNTIS